jgi:UDP-glucuronate 4-epimerase
MKKLILITGVAGFIAFHLSKKFLDNGYFVVGIDNLNSYYDPKLKNDRLKLLLEYKNFTFILGDISNSSNINTLKSYNFDLVINLAAQAGVRYSLTNPQTYIESNLIGFFNILQLCKESFVPLIYASSSSVYGNSTETPFEETLSTDKPVSLYGATKKCNEIIAESYFNSFNLPSAGLRFFTVYGPWGRPDMAYFSFTKKILNGELISLFNNGENLRDFTYVDDIVESIFKLSNVKHKSHEIFNIGNMNPISNLKLVNLLEQLLDKKANIELVNKQIGDVFTTYSNTKKLEELIQFKPNTQIENGLCNFIKWYKQWAN